MRIAPKVVAVHGRADVEVIKSVSGSGRVEEEIEWGVLG